MALVQCILFQAALNMHITIFMAIIQVNLCYQHTKLRILNEHLRTDLSRVKFKYCHCNRNNILTANRCLLLEEVNSNNWFTAK